MPRLLRCGVLLTKVYHSLHSSDQAFHEGRVPSCDQVLDMVRLEKGCKLFLELSTIVGVNARNRCAELCHILINWIDGLIARMGTRTFILLAVDLNDGIGKY